MRTPLLCQGDIFADVPRVYPTVAERVVEVDGRLRFLMSGPLEPGFAMLVTPSCSMGGRVVELDDGRRVAGDYEHPVRALVPLVPVETLAAELTAAKIGLAKKYDALANYMYMPAHVASAMPTSLALLYMPISLDHELLVEASIRVAQLSFIAGQQLRRKLVALDGHIELDRNVFTPSRD